MIYIALNIIFMTVVILILLCAGMIKKKAPQKHWWTAFVFLIVLTTIFDNVIIYSDIVDYDPSKILGVKLFYAPIEDFMYTVLSIIMIPALWKLYSKKEISHDK